MSLFLFFLLFCAQQEPSLVMHLQKVPAVTVLSQKSCHLCDDM